MKATTKVNIFMFVIMLIILGMLVFNIVSTSLDQKDEETVRIGVMFTDTVDDESWSQVNYEGMSAAVEKLGVQWEYRESIQVTESCIDTLKELIEEEGCNVIFGMSSGYGPYMLEMTNDYPDVKFYLNSGIMTTDTLKSYSGRMYQAKFLAGVVAGLQSDSGEIGYLTSYPMTETIRNANAFTLGVRSVNTDATVHTMFTCSWDDDETIEDATKKLLSDAPGIDVISTELESTVPMDIADEKGIWIIGNDLDLSEKYPDTWLTGTMWNWEGFYEEEIEALSQDNFDSSFEWGDLNDGLVSLSPMSDNVDEYIDRMTDYMTAQLESGSLEIFSGPLYDNSDQLHIKDGEQISDTGLLSDFRWYVKGMETTVYKTTNRRDDDMRGPRTPGSGTQAELPPELPSDDTSPDGSGDTPPDMPSAQLPSGSDNGSAGSGGGQDE